MAATVVLTALPADLLAEIDGEVGCEQREAFLTEVAQAELRRRRMRKFLAEMKESPPAWKDEDHPELADGSYAWVRKLREESEVRVSKAKEAWDAD